MKGRKSSSSSSSSNVEVKRTVKVPAKIDGRRASTDIHGYTKPVRSKEIADQLGSNLSDFPHQSPDGHRTDVVQVNSNSLDSGHIVMKRVFQKGGKISTGSKFTVDPNTGNPYGFKGGKANTDLPLGPPLSPEQSTMLLTVLVVLSMTATAMINKKA